MAEVTNVQPETIDKLLELSRAAWEELPETAGKIDNWYLADQLTYTEEWPLEKDNLRQLEEYANQGLMNKDQLSRYEELKRLVTKNRPLLDRILHGQSSASCQASNPSEPRT